MRNDTGCAQTLTDWPRTLKLASLVFATLVPAGANAAPPSLQSIAVTPVASSVGVGQTQRFVATGTYSDSSSRELGPAIQGMALGQYESCIVLKSGGVKCWGRNLFGQLGDGTTQASLIARRVKDIASAVAVDIQDAHACAVLASGAVKCWGDNGSGQLGNGTFAGSTVPVAVTGIRTATVVSVGWSHSCALLADGAIRCWGYNFYGQLGDGSGRRFATVPSQVAGIITANALAVGGGHSCAALASGVVQCWGRNEYGQLGNGTTTDSNTPVTVVGIENAEAVAAGGYFSCALLTSGGVKCWGHNGGAELGEGGPWPYEDSHVPVPVAGISTAVQILGGGFHACAVLRSGAARCWGLNRDGQLGDPSMLEEASSTPVDVPGIGTPARLATGTWHTCALLPDGAMHCWGLNEEGQLGNRSTYAPMFQHVNVVGTPGVVWRSSDRAKVTITYGGLAKARSVGNATITATTEGLMNANAVLSVE